MTIAVLDSGIMASHTAFLDANGNSRVIARTDVTPAAAQDWTQGVDTSSIELYGPWSEPTNEVTMPADVTAYVIAKGLSDARKKEQVQFDVTRWDPQSGITVEKRYDAMPGEIVGDYNKITRIPSQDVKEAKAPIDFNSHEVVLDANGGDQPVTQLRSAEQISSAGNRDQ